MTISAIELGTAISIDNLKLKIPVWNYNSITINAMFLLRPALCRARPPSEGHGLLSLGHFCFFFGGGGPGNPERATVTRRKFYKVDFLALVT